MRAALPSRTAASPSAEASPSGVCREMNASVTICVLTLASSAGVGGVVARRVTSASNAAVRSDVGLPPAAIAYAMSRPGPTRRSALKPADVAMRWR